MGGCSRADKSMYLNGVYMCVLVCVRTCVCVCVCMWTDVHWKIFKFAGYICPRECWMTFAYIRSARVLVTWQVRFFRSCTLSLPLPRIFPYVRSMRVVVTCQVRCIFWLFFSLCTFIFHTHNCAFHPACLLVMWQVFLYVGVSWHFLHIDFPNILCTHHFPPFLETKIMMYLFSHHALLVWVFGGHIFVCLRARTFLCVGIRATGVGSDLFMYLFNCSFTTHWIVRGSWELCRVLLFLFIFFGLGVYVFVYSFMCMVMYAFTYIIMYLFMYLRMYLCMYLRMYLFATCTGHWIVGGSGECRGVYASYHLRHCPFHRYCKFMCACIYIYRYIDI